MNKTQNRSEKPTTDQVSVHAFEVTVYNLDMEGFYLPNQIADIPNAVGNYAWACSSSIETADGGRCSGTFVSPEGHYLTALHCLGAWIKKYNLGEEVPPRDGQLKVTRVTQPTPAANAVADGFFLGDAPEVRDPQIVLLGKGIHYYSSDYIKTCEKTELARIIADYQDIAILKFDMSGKVVPHVKISRTAPGAGSKVWHISKPYAANRSNGFHSDGRTKYVTVGTVIDLEQSEAFRSGSGSCCNDCEQVKLLTYYGGSRIFSTVDYANGSSGGGIFNEMGELVGINVISLHDPMKGYVRGGGGFHSISVLHDVIGNHLAR